jgi:hypothetical protein
LQWNPYILRVSLHHCEIRPKMPTLFDPIHFGSIEYPMLDTATA